MGGPHNMMYSLIFMICFSWYMFHACMYVRVYIYMHILIYVYNALSLLSSLCSCSFFFFFFFFTCFVTVHCDLSIHGLAQHVCICVFFFVCSKNPKKKIKKKKKKCTHLLQSKH